MGFDARRFRREWISGAEGKKFAEVITEFTTELKELGPNPFKGGTKIMADKVKVGFLLLGGCAGCEMAVVDLSEKLVDALEHLEVVFWAPTAADVKYDDLASMEDGYIDVAFIDGMVRLDEHIHMAEYDAKKGKNSDRFRRLRLARRHRRHGQSAQQGRTFREGL